MRKMVGLLVGLILSLWLGVSLATAQSGYPQPTDTYINDFAHLLNPADTALITQLLTDLKTKNGIEATVVTLNSIHDYPTDDETIEAFATHLFNAWGIGDRANHKGVLILVAVRDRKVRIELGTGYESQYNDEMQQVINEQMLPAFKQGDYSRGLYQVLGAYDGQTIDFAYDLDGQPYFGYAVASTPVDGTTYVVLVSALDAEYDDLADEFDDMLYSFDILISGVSKTQAGPPAPDFADELFADDFSDPASGLISDETEQDWGRGYYTDAGQYRFELKPAPGAIYDYYPEQTLPADFLLQATASFSGAVNNAYGLIFRAQIGEEQDDFYTFRISGDGFYTIEKSGDNNKLTPLVDWTASPLIKQAEGETNILTVEGQGETYRFYINGQQVDTLTDAAYSEGTFGFMVDNFDEVEPVAITFDELRVGSAKR